MNQLTQKVLLYSAAILFLVGSCYYFYNRRLTLSQAATTLDASLLRDGEFNNYDLGDKNNDKRWRNLYLDNNFQITQGRVQEPNNFGGFVSGRGYMVVGVAAGTTGGITCDEICGNHTTSCNDGGVLETIEFAGSTGVGGVPQECHITFTSTSPVAGLCFCK